MKLEPTKEQLAVIGKALHAGVIDRYFSAADLFALIAPMVLEAAAQELAGRHEPGPPGTTFYSGTTWREAAAIVRAMKGTP